MIRLHLCQFITLPSYYDNGFDLLEEPAPILDTKVTLGHLRRLENVSETLIDFRGLYLAHITDKVGSLIQWCVNRKTNIIVFPEYSIPVEVLPFIHKSARDNSVLIIAGTHRVRLTEATRKIYQEISLALDDNFNGSAISPIFYPAGEVAISPKRSKSKWEPNLNIDLPQDPNIHSLTLNGQRIKIAVAPCIDSLQMTTLAPFWASEEQKPNILICPSMSPKSDFFESIGRSLAANETLFGFCNSSAFGGTTFNIPEEWNTLLEGYQTQSRSIPAQNEAILELDVDAEAFHLKKGTVVTKPPCKLPKEFLIVYKNNNSWLSAYESLKKDTLELLEKGQPPDAVEWIDSFLLMVS